MSISDADKKMLTGGIASEFFRFVFPSVVGLVAISSAGIVDGIFIGNYVGAVALASVNLVMPLLAIVWGILIMISLGGTVVAGRFLGEGDIIQASNIFTKTVAVVALVPLLLAFFCLLFPVPLSQALGAKGETIALAAEYLWVIAWFFPAFGFAVTFSQFARVDGRPGVSLLGLVGITVANIGLDYLMIVHLSWGIWGAAFASGLSFAIGSTILLVYFFTPYSRLKFVRPYGSWLVLFRTAFNGFSEFLNEASSGLIVLLFNWILITQVGAKGVAAFTIVDYVVYSGILIFYGVSEGIVPLISVNYGGQKPDRIRKFFQIGVAVNMAIGGVLIAILLLWPNGLIGLFLSEEEPEIRKLSADIISIVWVMFVFLGANIAISAYFTGVQLANQSALIAAARSLLLPVALILLFWYLFGYMGAFYALPLSEALTFLLCLYLLRGRWPNQVIARKESK